VQGAGWSDRLWFVGCAFICMCASEFICSGWKQNVLLHHMFIFSASLKIRNCSVIE
jgi:hypothetical protein